jgi:transposase
MFATSGRFPVPAPPAALFFYSPDRKSEHPKAHLQDFQGVIHADGYSGFNGLFAGNRIAEAACRVGGGVAIPAPHRPGRADYPHPVLRAQASLRRRCTGGRSRLAARDTT